MTDTEIEAVWLYAGEAWPNYRVPESVELESVRRQAWRDQLGDLDLAHVRAAIAELGSSEFFPPLGKIRESALDLARVERGESRVPDVDEAWAEVVQAFHQIGSYHVPVWSHPAVAVTVRALDWQTMCMSTEPEVMRGQFAKLYGVCRDRHVRDSRPAAPAVAAILERAAHRMSELDEAAS